MLTGAVYVVLFLSLTLGQQLNVLPTHERCKRVPGKLDFDLTKFNGIWYQYRSFGSTTFGTYGHCAYANYSYNPQSQNIFINYTQTVKGSGKLEYILGHGVFADPDQNEGKLWIVYHGEHTRSYVVAITYIVDTDYTNWAVLYSCGDAGQGEYYGESWIMTRNRNLIGSPSSRTILARISRTLNQINLSLEDYDITDHQTNCAG